MGMYYPGPRPMGQMNQMTPMPQMPMQQVNQKNGNDLVFYVGKEGSNQQNKFKRGKQVGRTMEG